MFPIDLPFSFAEGDRISGTFTYEPHDAASNSIETVTIQDGVFSFEVGSFQVYSNRYELRSLDDSTSDENPIPEDRIDLRCSFGGNLACSPQVLAGNPNIEWAFFAAFVGRGDVLDGPDFPESSAVWNGLLPGSLLVTFSDREIQRSNGFIASIDSVHITPEPATGTVLAVLMLIGTSLRFPYRPRR